MSAILPYGTQWIDEDDIQAVVNVLRNGNLTQGPQVRAFEDALAAYTGARFCVAFCNATAALHSAVAALDLEKGSEGITSPNTFVASSNCLAYNQLKPVFADIDPRTFNVTADTLRQRLSAGTRVLIPVHFAGQACEMAPIAELARARKLRVIEDAAHAIGSTYADGSRVGNCRYSDMTVFSFHPVKTLTTGEGGAVTTNDEALYSRLLLLRSHGITKDPRRLSQNPGPWYYEQQALGFNFRITDMQCALGVSQLAKVERFKARRRQIVAAYNHAFEDVRHVTPPFEAEGLSSCFHLYVLLVDFQALGKGRAQVMGELLSLGVGSQVLYIPVHTQPWYCETYGYGWGQCPCAEAYYEKALSLPLYPKLTDGDVQTVVDAVRKVCA